MKNSENKEYLYLTFRRLFASVMILSTLLALSVLQLIQQ